MTRLTADRDRGLTHLGLVAETLGWAQAAVAFALTLLLIVSATSRLDAHDINPWAGGAQQVSELEGRMFLAALAMLVGALLLAMAGRGLSSGSPRAARAYVVGGSLAGIAFTLALMGQADAISVVAALVVALAWPVVMLIALRLCPRSPEALLSARIPRPIDGGLHGLRQLMRGSAAVEIVAAAGALWFALTALEVSFLSTPSAALAVLLTARALVQFIATVAQDMRGWSRRYTALGIASGPAFLIVSVASTRQKELLIMALGTAAVLCAWPYVVRRFLTRIDSEHEIADAAPDRGLSSLGWLLLVLGAYQTAALALGLLTHLARGGTATIGAVLPAILACMQLWVAIEVLSLSWRMRMAALQYTIAGAATGIFAWREMLASESNSLSGGSMHALGGIGAAATLALPLVTLLIVLRATRETA